MSMQPTHPTASAPPHGNRLSPPTKAAVTLIVAAALYVLSLVPVCQMAGANFLMVRGPRLEIYRSQPGVLRPEITEMPWLSAAYWPLLYLAGSTDASLEFTRACL
ncbi:hypothetical protein DB346_13455 [Verrucomicrobia bacterium LW23]|nr:hypothetical protein DB346_13455 [Verrucomicrobia bacterium LW23]